MKKLIITLCIVLIIFCFHLCSWEILGDFVPYSEHFAINRINTMLPLLKDQRITFYRNQEWCKVLKNKNGTFGESSNPSTCFFIEDLSSFNNYGHNDFQKIKEMILFSGLKIRTIQTEFNSSDEIIYAEFELDSQTLTYLRYVYSPGSKQPSRDGERKNFQINENWYFQIEDWM